MCNLCERLVSSIGRTVVTVACAAPSFRTMRERMIPMAEGDVLEIGVGSGHNLGLYDRDRIRTLVGIDPDAVMLDMARRNAENLERNIRLIEASAEELPIETRSVDTVVASYVLCTIPRPGKALAEIARVMRPDGRLIFLEHSAASGRILSRMQRHLNSGWGLLAGGCNLTRNPCETVTSGGFALDSLVEEAFSGRLALLGRHVAGIARLQRAEQCVDIAPRSFAR